MKREEPLVSVIIPIYNVRAYVERCLESVISQTYRNMEIIVVDDASDDGSGGICDIYADRDKRLQVVHFPVNQGVSEARNEGIRRAGGKFVTFVDGDDYVKPELVERLYDNLKTNHADISICGTEGMDGKGIPASTYSREAVISCMARRTPFLWTPWGKMYVMEYVKECPFDKNTVCGEDLPFFYQMVKRAGKISYFPDKLYHYTHRDGSAVHHGVDEKRCAVLSVLDSICEDACLEFPEAVPGLNQLAMNTDVRLSMDAVEEGMERERLFRYLKRFQKHIRRHFSWNALRLCPQKKDGAAEVMLYFSAVAFWGLAAAYKLKKAAAHVSNIGEQILE